MKLSSVAFVLTALIIATPMLTLCKQSTQTDTVETIKPHTNIAQYLSPDIKYMFRSYKYIGGKKLIYIYPQEKTQGYNSMHTISPEDNALYKENNIEVFKQDCSIATLDQLKKLKPFHWWNLFGKNRKFGYKSFSLISDNNKTIDIYVIKIFGNDWKFYATSHAGRIAVLINEEGYIVSILDDVKNENEILNAL